MCFAYILFTFSQPPPWNWCSNWKLVCSCLFFSFLKMKNSYGNKVLYNLILFIAIISWPKREDYSFIRRGEVWIPLDPGKVVEQSQGNLFWIYTATTLCCRWPTLIPFQPWIWLGSMKSEGIHSVLWINITERREASSFFFFF